MKNETAIQSENHDNELLRKAKEALDYARQKENEARIALSHARETTKTLKEKHEGMFDECQKRAWARRKSGQIVVNPGY